MSSPGCTRHVVKMTSENFLKHLTFRAATAATYEHRSKALRGWTADNERMNLLRTNATSVVEAEVTRSNGIGNRLTKSLTNPEQNSTERTLQSVLLASSSGYGQCASLEMQNREIGLAQTELDQTSLNTHDKNYENVDL